MGKTSFVWNEFKVVDRDYAQCMVDGCDKKIKHSAGTRGMIYHLHNVHKIDEAGSVKREFADEFDLKKDRQGKHNFIRKSM